MTGFCKTVVFKKVKKLPFFAKIHDFSRHSYMGVNDLLSKKV